MTSKEDFLNAINDHPEDDLYRQVYADWLDDHGEYDGAQRQRNYKKSVQFLKNWVEKIRDDTQQSMEVLEASTNQPLTYENVLRVARSKLEHDEWGDECIRFLGMNDPWMHDEDEFWEAVSVVTCLPIPDAIKRHHLSIFSCSC